MKFIITIITLFIILPPVADAATVNFSGAISYPSEVDNVFGVQVGDIFSGTLSYDENIPSPTGSNDYGFYLFDTSDTYLNITINDAVYFANGLNSFFRGDIFYGTPGKFEVRSRLNSFPEENVDTIFTVGFYNYNGFLLSTVYPPDASILTNFSLAYFAMEIVSGESVGGEITSLSPVPLPQTIFLFGCGFVAILGTRKKRR